MNKFILPGAALALGLLAGTAWTVVAYEPPMAAVADSAALALEAGDSTVAHEAHGDGPAGVAGEAGDEAGGADADAGAHPAGGAADEAAPHTPPEAWERPLTADGAEAEADAEDGVEAPATREPDGAAQLARIFAAMQAKDAARVLSQLTDREIEKVLVRMGTRQAAAVLSNLEPDRAAVLTRAVLGRATP